MRTISPKLLNTIWLAVALLLVVGVSQPMFTFTHFYFFDDTFSLTSGIFHLLAQGELILFGLLFCFSLLMPALKMLMLLYSINSSALFTQRQQRNLDHIALIGKWSMLDVFVIAILAVTIKLSMVAQVSIHYGLIVFALGVIASMGLPYLINIAQPQLKPNSHANITLQNTQLEQLFNDGEVTIDNHLLDARIEHKFGDIFDSGNQWQAKVTLTATTSPYQQIHLSLIAKRMNEN